MQRSLVSQVSTRLRRGRIPATLLRLLLVLVALPPLLGSRGTQAHPAAHTALERAMMLSGSVPPPVLSGAAHRLRMTADEANQPVTLTVVLRRGDEAGFEQYLAGVQDPHSPSYGHFLTQQELADRFGPSQTAYETVLGWLRAQGFALAQGSANRLTLTVKGTRQQAERAFKVNLGDYRLGTRTFYANAEDPTIPASIAGDVLSVVGLSDLAQPAAPRPLFTDLPTDPFDCVVQLSTGGHGGYVAFFGILLGLLAILSAGLALAAEAFYLYFITYLCVGIATRTGRGEGPGRNSRGAALDPPNPQKIGLLEYDTFHMSDVSDWLNLISGSSALAGQVSEVSVNGGVPQPGAGEPEVLVDIDTVLGLNRNASNRYVVYDAPQGTSFAQLFNAMINDGDTVISNSWLQCEDQTSLTEAQGIDSVLANAEASGISVFNASGDTGSTCFDGSPNTIGVPADSPHATAVGGTSFTFGPGLTYGGETWWGAAAQNPPTGQGSYGVSRYFSRPSYQDGLTNSPMRSVPDLATVADPRTGLGICQADAGGCPNGSGYGGTSMAAPVMAAETALLNQALGHNVGQVNPVLYPLANTPNAFHTAASMGSDFAHVGMGDPDMDYLRLALSHQSIGPADASSSLAAATSPIPADGATQGIVQVDLADANGYPVAGKTVTLTPNAGSHAVVSAASGPSSVTDGAVTFTVTDTVPETVTFTVATNGVTLSNQPTIVFVPPPATGGSIQASPGNVLADGATPSTITVTLHNAQGQGAQGKTIVLSQGAGHAVLTGSGITDASGTATFQATDLTVETVTFTAVDATDGNLPVPGTAQVSFTGSGGGPCPPAPPPTAGSGFAFSPFASGFYTGNVPSLGSCASIGGSAFDAAGNLYVADAVTGDIYKFGAAGEVATGATRITQTPLGSWVEGLAFGKNGDLYALQTATNGSFAQGKIYQLDPATGAVKRTVADNLLGDLQLGVDPLSGDLFAGNSFFSGAPQSPNILRIHDLGAGNPPVDCTSPAPNTNCSVYAAPGAVSAMFFDPDGSLYVRGTLNQPTISVISGTNSAQPGAVTVLDSALSGAGGMSEVQPEANGKYAMVAVGQYTGISGDGYETDEVDLNHTQAQPVPIVAQVAGGFTGPDGCLYLLDGNGILKVTNAAGGCAFAPASGAVPALHLSPGAITPNPGTGSPVTFTATLANVSNAQDTDVFFAVGGANPQGKVVHVDANGQASFTYTGVLTGADQVTAGATITSTTTVTPTILVSNVGQVTWAAGKHVSFASLNLSPTGGFAGAPVTLQASLTDVSAQPPVPIGGGSLTIQLGAQSCLATTDSTGTGSCSFTPNEAAGSYPLRTSYAGDGQHTAATASASFVVIGSALLQAQPGWNLIDLPLTPTSPLNASTVLAGVLQQGGQLAALFALKNNQWTPSLIQQAGKPAIGQDFPLQPGAGYLLYSDQSASYRETGTVPVPPPTWNVTQGWNLVGTSFGATGVISASTVLAGVLQQGGGHLAALYGLSHGQWTPSLIQVGTSGRIGQDFALQPGAGYLLYSDTTVPGFTPSASGRAAGVVPLRPPWRGGAAGGTFPALPTLPAVAGAGLHR